jgi:hypothetical protein
MADEQQQPQPVPYQPAEGTTSAATSAGPGTGTALPGGVATAQQARADGPPGNGGRRRARNRRDLGGQFLQGMRTGWTRGIGLLASAVMIFAVILAVIFAVHILFAVFGANQANSIVEFVNQWAGRFAWRFSSLFTPHSQKVAALANFGIAAVAYLIAGRIVAGIIRRFG